jgi:hypothetical protein
VDIISELGPVILHQHPAEAALEQRQLATNTMQQYFDEDSNAQPLKRHLEWVLTKIEGLPKPRAAAARAYYRQMLREELPSYGSERQESIAKLFEDNTPEVKIQPLEYSKIVGDRVLVEVVQ